MIVFELTVPDDRSFANLFSAFFNAALTATSGRSQQSDWLVCSRKGLTDGKVRRTVSRPISTGCGDVPHAVRRKGRQPGQIELRMEGK